MPEFTPPHPGNGEHYVFSQTAINRARKCLEQARSMWTGEITDSTGVQALVGTAAHAYLFHSYNDDPQVAAVAAADALTAEWDTMRIAGSHKWENSMLLALESAVEAGTHWKTYLPYPPVLAEERLSMVLPYGKYPKRLDGTPDCVRDGYELGPFEHNKDTWFGPYKMVVTDLKCSAGYMYHPRDAWRLRRYAVQPTVYTALVADHYGLPIEEVGFEYLVHNPDTHKPHTIAVHRTEADLIRLAREMDSLIDQWLRGTEGPWPLSTSDWHCSPTWCPNYDRCIGKPYQPTEGDSSARKEARPIPRSNPLKLIRGGA